MLHSALGLDLSSPELTPSPPSSSVSLVSPIVADTTTMSPNVTTPTRSTGNASSLGSGVVNNGGGVPDEAVESDEDVVVRRRSRNSGSSPRKKRNDLRRPAVLDVSYTFLIFS